MHKYQGIWDEVKKLLIEARGFLNINSSSVYEIDDDEFFEYLKHNELESALDELEEISDSFEVPKEFWQCLVKAANLMDLKVHSKRYLKFRDYY